MVLWRILSFNLKWNRFRVAWFAFTVNKKWRKRKKQNLKCVAPFFYRSNLPWNKLEFRKKNKFWANIQSSVSSYANMEMSRKQKEKKTSAKLYVLTWILFFRLVLWIKWAQNRNIYYHFSVKKWFLQFFNVPFFWHPFTSFISHLTKDPTHTCTHCITSVWLWLLLLIKALTKTGKGIKIIVHSNGIEQNEVKGWYQLDIVLLLLFMLQLKWFYFQFMQNVCVYVVWKIYWELLQM